jgi:hypothetical protein
MKISTIQDVNITDNKICEGCGYLMDCRKYKEKCFFCLLFHRCLPDTLEHCEDCKKARAGELIKTF